MKINVFINVIIFLALMSEVYGMVIDDAAFNKMLSDGRQDELEDLLNSKINQKSILPNELYYFAVLERSRFNKEVVPEVYKRLSDEVGLERKQALSLIIKIDSRVDERYSFKALRQLAVSTKDNSILWLSCISCRELRENKIGKQMYEKLSMQWSPGPILFHQTYGNILDDLREYDTALIHREMALKIKETSWKLEAHGNTLSNLTRYMDAERSYRKAIAIKGTSSLWYNLGNCLYSQERIQEAEAAFRESLRLNSKNTDSRAQLGFILRDQKRFKEAEVEILKALSAANDSVWIYKGYERMLRGMNRIVEAD